MSLEREQSALQQTPTEAVFDARQSMSAAALQVVCAHSTAHLVREEARLGAVQKLLLDHKATAFEAAKALSLIADDRDAYVYYRASEELGLDWDFSDPETTRAQVARFQSFTRFFEKRQRPFSNAALACASKPMLESLWANAELEQKVLTLRSHAMLTHSWEHVVNEVADMLEAAAAVQAFQLEHGILMRLCLACQDSQATEKLSVRLHGFADAIASLSSDTSLQQHQDL